MAESKDKEKDNNTIHCSFCGRSNFEVNSMVAGPSATVVNDASLIVKNDLSTQS